MKDWLSGRLSILGQLAPLPKIALGIREPPDIKRVSSEQPFEPNLRTGFMAGRLQEHGQRLTVIGR